MVGGGRLVGHRHRPPGKRRRRRFCLRVVVGGAPRIRLSALLLKRPVVAINDADGREIDEIRGYENRPDSCHWRRRAADQIGEGLHRDENEGFFIKVFRSGILPNPQHGNPQRSAEWAAEGAGHPQLDDFVVDLGLKVFVEDNRIIRVHLLHPAFLLVTCWGLCVCSRGR